MPNESTNNTRPVVKVNDASIPMPLDARQHKAVGGKAGGGQMGGQAGGQMGGQVGGKAGGQVGGQMGGKPGGKAGSKRRAKTAIIVIICILVALAIWLCVWMFACSGSDLFDSNAQTGQAPYKTQEEMQAELNRKVEEGMFNISISSNIDFDSGEGSGTAYIENIPGNNYLMQVAITDDDSGEELYRSGILKPNQYIEKISLSRDLPPGTYQATATFTALDSNTFEEVGTAAAKVTLNVLS